MSGTADEFLRLFWYTLAQRVLFHSFRSHTLPKYADLAVWKGVFFLQPVLVLWKETVMKPIDLLWVIGTCLCHRFLPEDRGQAVADYVLLFVLIVVVMISFVAALAQNIGELLSLLPAFFAGRS
jgi:Flp pilus assembly pilin Flp